MVASQTPFPSHEEDQSRLDNLLGMNKKLPQKKKNEVIIDLRPATLQAKKLFIYSLYGSQKRKTSPLTGRQKEDTTLLTLCKIHKKETPTTFF